MVGWKQETNSRSLGVLFTNPFTPLFEGTYWCRCSSWEYKHPCTMNWGLVWHGKSRYFCRHSHCIEKYLNVSASSEDKKSTIWTKCLSFRVDMYTKEWPLRPKLRFHVLCKLNFWQFCSIRASYFITTVTIWLSTFYLVPCWHAEFQAPTFSVNFDSKF